MTNIKDALERLRDHLRVEARKTETCYTCYTDQAAFIATRLNTILASPQGEDAVERVAETIWRAELRRATGKERAVPWLEISEVDQERFRYVARAILATGLVPDEAAIRADNTANLISIIADIREKTGLGGKPMLNDLADAIAAEMDRRVADEREKCAKVAEQSMLPCDVSASLILDRYTADTIAAAIRSGGGK